MTHSLTLPELIQPDDAPLSWDVRLDSVGRIEVRLLKSWSLKDVETVFSIASSELHEVVQDAAHAWNNYKIVHGIER